MEILAFYAIAIEPIEIQKCSAPQNDRLDLSFFKDIYLYADKLTSISRKTAIQLSQILATTLYMALSNELRELHFEHIHRKFPLKEQESNKEIQKQRESFYTKSRAMYKNQKPFLFFSSLLKIFLEKRNSTKCIKNNQFCSLDTQYVLLT